MPRLKLPQTWPPTSVLESPSPPRSPLAPSPFPKPPAALFSSPPNSRWVRSIIQAGRRSGETSHIAPYLNWLFDVPTPMDSSFGDGGMIAVHNARLRFDGGGSFNVSFTPSKDSAHLNLKFSNLHAQVGP